ncbi:MAG: Unknown protein [uncultured Sulfurovum sp.]|uniref:SGNH hydrolase-type esterase domain-containing protein n=1 Tax=uncultured Sulfurovum sp. TaxID=269237 RepID=A0A6S6T9Y4_9BACT|nr:MAG: Unknown protein [uncultured Sulfurovum sp.]
MKKTIIFILSLFLALLGFELFLKYSPFEYGTSPGEYDKDIGVWHKKNFSGYSISECYKTKYYYDDKGLPKSTKPYDKEKDDIVFLGDSFVEAVMIPNPHIIHNAFAKHLNYKYNVLNYGLSGTSAVQSFMILKKKVNLAKTDYVIEFVELDGDLLEVDYQSHNSMSRPKVYLDFKSLTEYKVIPPRAINLKDKVGDFLGNYQIYFFIKKLIYSLQKKITTPTTKKEVVENLSKNWLYLQASIYQTYLLAKQNNIKFLLIINAKDTKNKDKLTTFLKKENIPFMSIQEVAEEKGIELQTFSCDGHWTKETHNDISKIILESGFIQSK